MEKGSLIIDIRNSSGFFSNFLIWVDNLKYCEINNLKPIMRLWANNWFYSDGRDNLWDYFFESINDGVPVGNLEHSHFFKFWDDDSSTCHLGKVTIWDNIGNKEKCTHNRLEVNKIVRKMKPSKNIQKKIDDFIEKNFKDQKVLGVHIRGTDYEYSNLDEYLVWIKKYSDFDKVFVATDNFESLTFIKNNVDNVCNYETDLRTTTMDGKVLCKNISPTDKLKHGEDVLIECCLLSKCDHLISINSNVAASALYMNPNMTFDMIYRSPHGG